MKTGPVTATFGGGSILAAVIALYSMYSSGTIDVASASAAIGVIFAGFNSLFSHTA